MAYVDTFVLYDDMQYTRRDWRNRNKIKTPYGLKWLTIPVKVKGKYQQKINETEIAQKAWTHDHWQKLYQNYKKAPFFEVTSEWLEPLYTELEEKNLSRINRIFIEKICAQLSISTKIYDSSKFRLAQGKNECLVTICEQLGATEYISGPAAKDYIDENLFKQRGIKLSWFEYGDYPSYAQLWGDFDHFVTILDLFFNAGKNAPKYMRYVK